jgi:predicted nucleotidyltransferase
VDVSRPYADVLSGARGKVLAALVQLAVPVTARALARYAGVAPQTALDAVDDLEQAGIVLTERTGGLVLASLNREHLLVQPVEMLVRTRVRLTERLNSALDGFPLLAAAWLFGSAARGDGNRESDIDLFLVSETATDAPAWVDAVETLADHVRSWTGNRPQVVEHSWESFVQLVRENNLLIAKIRADGIALTPQSRERLRDAA